MGKVNEINLENKEIMVLNVKNIIASLLHEPLTRIDTVLEGPNTNCWWRG